MLGGQQLEPYDPMEALKADPSIAAWPPTMPIELALKIGTPKAICQAYGIDRDEWERISKNPVFIAEVGRAVEALRIDGMAFKMRSQLQSVQLLQESWRMIHDADTPHNVKADLIKSTIRWAGLDASKDAAVAAAKGGGNLAFQININLA